MQDKPFWWFCSRPITLGSHSKLPWYSGMNAFQFLEHAELLSHISHWEPWFLPVCLAGYFPSFSSRHSRNSHGPFMASYLLHLSQGRGLFHVSDIQLHSLLQQLPQYKGTAWLIVLPSKMAAREGGALVLLPVRAPQPFWSRAHIEESAITHILKGKCTFRYMCTVKWVCHL